ncbi:MAG: Rid family detoxifying hydrolase [Nitrospinota bacterium]
MSKQVIVSNEAPYPIGRYSQAIIAGGDLLFISGQLGVRKATMKLCSDDLKDQTEQIFSNIAPILAEVGLTFDDVVKSTLFLTNLEDSSVVNDIYSLYFKEEAPARSLVEVQKLPLNAKVMIEMIATTRYSKSQ